MSVILRSLFRDPLVSRYSRPASRAMRRWDSDFLDDLPVAVPHRRPWRAMAVDPWWDDHIGRDFVDAVNKLQEFAEDMESVSDHWLNEKRARLGEAGELTMKRASDGSLQLAMDVSGFKPENLNIEVVDDHLVVEAKNESSAENSYSKSEIRRWFKLPEDCKLEDIQSNLTSDNKLMISLPSSKPAVEHRTRKIPIKVDQRSQIENGKSHESANHQSGNKIHTRSQQANAKHQHDGQQQEARKEAAA